MLETVQGLGSSSNVEDLLHERGIDVSHESVRFSVKRP